MMKVLSFAKNIMDSHLQINNESVDRNLRDELRLHPPFVLSTQSRYREQWLSNME